MTQEAEAVAMDLNIVSCQTCDQMFVESERRQTCPSCGGPPVGPYFQFVLDGAGLHLKDGAAPAAAPSPPADTLTEEHLQTMKGKGFINREEAVEQLMSLSYSREWAEAEVAKWEREPAPEPEAPAPEVPAAEEEAEEERAITGAENVGVYCGAFVGGSEVVSDAVVRGLLADLGAEPEAAAIAVGRLAAVRDLLRELVAAGGEAQVEVAVEETPVEPPEPEGEPAT